MILLLCIVQSPPPPPLHVYSRRHRPKQPLSDSLQVSTILSPPNSITEADLLAVLHKSILSTCNLFPHYIVLSYHRLSSSFHTSFSSISYVFIPKSVSEALTYFGWRQTMLDELTVL